MNLVLSSQKQTGVGLYMNLESWLELAPGCIQWRALVGTNGLQNSSSVTVEIN
jgi:hypothetical protein